MIQSIENLISSNRLRVAFLAENLIKRGAEKQLFYMIRALHAVGVEVRVYTLLRGGFYDEELQKIGIEPVEVGNGSNLDVSSFKTKLTNHIQRGIDIAIEIRKFRPHIVQSAHHKTNLYLSMFRVFPRMKTVGSIRAEYTLIEQSFKKLTTWVINGPEALIVNSLNSLHQIENAGISCTSRLFFLANVIDLDHFDINQPARQDFPNLKKRIVVVFVAQLATIKRVDRFLKALAIARITIPELHGLVIGDGSERTTSELLAEDLGLFPSHVTFLGYRSDISNILSYCDVQMLTSESEGFPNAIMEGMAARLPIITTDVGDTSVMVEHGVTGFVSSSGDPVELARYVVELARSPHLRKKMGDLGRQRIEENHSFSNLEIQLLRIYHQLAAKDEYLKHIIYNVTRKSTKTL